MKFDWPENFERIPGDEWVERPLADLALKYNTVENHGWYSNLDRTLELLHEFLRDGNVLVDYSGGTGILASRMFNTAPDIRVGVAIVDASPKFLRLALERFRDDERVAFRWIRYVKPERRLQLLDEVFHLEADAITSTNAIHLYYDLDDTLRSWFRVLKPGGHVFVQSGNIRVPEMPANHWIIDETVEAIHEQARTIARENDRYARWRPVLDDTGRMKRYARLRKKYFLPVRPLEHYLDAMKSTGLKIEDVETRTIVASVAEWYEFLGAYHDGVLGWAGGVEKIDGTAPGKDDMVDRLALMRSAMERTFEGRASFDCCWTYINAHRA